jgi:hypothetical protein
MRLPIDEELRSICGEIVASGRSLHDWVAIESDDAFQSAHYCGGYDAVEHAFCFSRRNGPSELWLQLTPEQVAGVVKGVVTHVEARPPED